MIKEKNPTFVPTLVGRIPATEGVVMALRFVRTIYLAEVSGVPQTVISQSISHSIINGKPLWFTEKRVPLLQDAIRKIGSQLAVTSILPGEVSEVEQPYGYGADYIEKFAALRKVVNPTALLRDVLGWSPAKVKLHLSDKSKEKYYGKFSDSDLDDINRAIHSVAAMLCSIELEYENVTDNCE